MSEEKKEIKKRRLKKFLIILSSIVVSLALFWIIVGVIEPYQVTDVNPWRSERTLISAHRGGANLNPENTRMAFDYVINETPYTDVVEIDVRLTKDDELVIIHDASINRTGLDYETEEILVRESSYNDLAKYNLGINFEKNGQKPYSDTSKLTEKERKGLTIMKLTEFFDEYKEVRDFKLLLEIKDEKEDAKLAVDKVEELLAMEKYSWWDERTMIISFSTDAVNHVIENYPDRYVAGMGYNMVPFLIGSVLGLDSLFKVEYQSIQTSMITKAGPISINCATKTFVNSAHRRNQCVAYWTINERSDMEYLISIGADIITTNSPDLLAEVLGRK